MIDIANALSIAVQEKECSSLYALLLLFNKENDNVDILQPQPTEEVSRGLRDKGDFKTNGARLGENIHRDMCTGLYVK